MSLKTNNKRDVLFTSGQRDTARPAGSQHMGIDSQMPNIGKTKLNTEKPNSCPSEPS
jgi:hypothetical protein